MGMPGQPEILAAATDANHFRPLEAVEDPDRVHFASEYIDGQVLLSCHRCYFCSHKHTTMRIVGLSLFSSARGDVRSVGTIDLSFNHTRQSTKCLTRIVTGYGDAFFATLIWQHTERMPAYLTDSRRRYTMAIWQ